MGAVTISITTCLTIRKALEFKTRHMTGAKLMLFNTLSSFIACSISGYLNMLTMRRIELEQGIEVFDDDGKSYGSSLIAARHAVF